MRWAVVVTSVITTTQPSILMTTRMMVMSMVTATAAIAALVTETVSTSRKIVIKIKIKIAMSLKIVMTTMMTLPRLLRRPFQSFQTRPHSALLLNPRGPTLCWSRRARELDLRPAALPSLKQRGERGTKRHAHRTVPQNRRGGCRVLQWRRRRSQR